MEPAGLELRDHDPRTAPEQEMAAVLALRNALQAEVQPDDPPRSLEVALARARNAPSFSEVRAWTLWSGDRVVALAEVEIERTGDNEHLCDLTVGVHPDHRRRGLARALLAPAVEYVRAERRTHVLGATVGHEAGAAFAERLGGRIGQVDRVSELCVADADRDLLRTWLEEGPVRAPGYELVRWEAGVPEDDIAEFCRLFDATNTAPRDDLEMDDEHLTPEQLREWEASFEAEGGETISHVVRHRATGRLVGFTDLYWSPLEPHRAEQGWTAVEPEHRGHALGKWLKAAAFERLTERWPAVVKIKTDNAVTNDAMLGINVAMGFRPAREVTIWQIPVEGIEAYLSSPGA